MLDPMSFEGVVVPLVTPFSADEAIDYKAYGLLIELLIEAGVHGFMVNAATGEFFHLEEAERKAAAEFVVDHTNGRLPVIVGAGGTSTRESIMWARHAEKCGADGILLMPPYYVPLPVKDVMMHVRTVADSIDIPTMYYSNPGASQVKLSVGEVCSLVTEANVPWLKLSTADIAQVPMILNELEDRVRIFEGWDPLAFQSMCGGAIGWTAGPANAMPELTTELWRLTCKEADLVAAGALNRRLAPMLDLLAQPGMFTPGIKHLLNLRGLRVGGVRAPYCDLDADQIAKLNKEAARLGIG